MSPPCPPATAAVPAGAGRALRALAVAAAVTGAPLAGERPVSQLPEPLGGMRLGPVRVRPVYRLDRFGYDSNVFLDSRNESGDFTATFTGGLEGQTLFGHRAALSFETLPSATAFLESSGQNYLSGLARVRGDLVLKRISLFASSGWDTTRSRGSSEFDERTRVRSNRVSGGAAWIGSGRLSVSTTLTRHASRYTDRNFRVNSTECGFDDAAIGTLLDRSEVRGDLRTAVRVLSRTKAFVELSRDRMRFDRCSARDSRQRAWMAGLEFLPGGAVSGTVKAGPADFDAEASGREDFDGVLGEADLTVRPGGSWRVDAGWRRGVDFSIFEENLFAVGTRASASVLRALGSRVAVEIGAERERLSWPDDRTLRREDRIEHWYVGTRLKSIRRSTLGVRLGYRRRTSNLEGIGDKQITLFTDARL